MREGEEGGDKAMMVALTVSRVWQCWVSGVRLER